VELANDVNEHMPHYVVSRVVASLNERERAVKGSAILVLGLAYKRNTGDAREAPSTSVIEQLVTMGADVMVADPHVSASAIDSLVTRVDATPEVVRTADLVVLLVDHDNFDLDMVSAEAVAILDTCAAMSPGTAEVL
jgi:UDP-N-acetyl-D-glucosamine dehydrogenase